MAKIAGKKVETISGLDLVKCRVAVDPICTGGQLRDWCHQSNVETMHIRRKARDHLAGRPGFQPSSPRPWDPPQTHFPGIVPISTSLVGQSDRGAIAITSMSAYTIGFGFVITRLVRPGTLGWDEEPFMAQSRFEVSLRFPDGRTVSTGRPPVTPSQPGRSCGCTAAAVARITTRCDGGPGRCRPAGRWSSSANGRAWASAKPGSASKRG